MCFLYRYNFYSARSVNRNVTIRLKKFVVSNNFEKKGLANFSLKSLTRDSIHNNNVAFGAEVTEIE